MLLMQVRNRVQDFATWKRVFDQTVAERQAAGLHFHALWVDADDPSTVIFTLEVMDRERAEAFVATPEAAARGEEAGVIDGDYRYLTTPPAGR
jgi:hypothetical protein